MGILKMRLGLPPFMGGLICIVTWACGNVVFGNEALGRESLYDNLIYSMPKSAGRTGGGRVAVNGKKIIKPSSTMLSGIINDVNHHLEKAHIAMLQGRNLDAGWHYFYVTQADPGNGLALEGLALSVAKTGNVPTAHKMFRRLYETSPSEVRYRIQLAASEFHLGEYEKSLTRLKLPEGIAESYDSLYLRGLCYYATGQVRLAIESLQQAHEVKLTRAEPLKAMAEIFASRKMKEPVERLLKQVKVLAAPEDFGSFRKRRAFDFLSAE